MKLLAKLFEILGSGLRKSREVRRKALADYKQELLVKQGREQFKKLMDKGLNVPVALL